MNKVIAFAALTLAAVTCVPSIGKAQGYTCPVGYTTIMNSDGTTTCSYTYHAPEISASSSEGGVALLLCGVMMLRRRKPSHTL